jgi:hypothetical protein
VKNQGLGIVEESAPSRTEEEPTSSISIRGDRYVGATLWMMVKTWTNLNLIREPLRMSWP